MENIELVIKIPEEDYKHILHRQREYCITTSKLEDVIANGTPLPKGHGRLIDADAINRKDVNCANVPMNFIDTAPTIIEADKESEVV